MSFCLTFSFRNKRNQIRVRNEYNTWKKTKNNMKKNKNYLNNFFIIFNFILYYLLKLNDVLYKKIKKILCFLLIFDILLSNLKWYT